MKTLKKIHINILILVTIISSFNMSAQSVDIIASVDVTAPLTVGDTFTYTLQAIAGTTNYQGVQVYLEYNPAVIQLNSLTPDLSLLYLILENTTTTPGLIRYASGSFAAATGTTTLFTAVFEVVGTSENVMIVHDLLTNGNQNGTAVSDSLGQNVIGTTNDIILVTLHTEQNNFSNSISVFPNPVNDVVNIKINTTSLEVKSINLFSVDGKLVAQHTDINSNTISIDTSKLENAIYFMKITSNKNETETFKILVNH